MKLLIIANIFCGVCLSCLLWASTSGQYADDPTVHFKPFQFDTLVRGVYNGSECILDLMQCLELVRPDVMCRFVPGADQFMYGDTICPFLKEYCHDYFGEYNKLNYDKNTLERMSWLLWRQNCDYKWDSYSRRADVELKGKLAETASLIIIKA